MYKLFCSLTGFLLLATSGWLRLSVDETRWESKKAKEKEQEASSMTLNPGHLSSWRLVRRFYLPVFFTRSLLLLPCLITCDECTPSEARRGGTSLGAPQYNGSKKATNQKWFSQPSHPPGESRARNVSLLYFSYSRIEKGSDCGSCDHLGK